MNLATLRIELHKLASPDKAKLLAQYFKTGKGEYAEGDIFLGGITTDTSKAFAKKYQDLLLADIRKLLESKYHEERWIGSGILGIQFKKADDKTKTKLYKFYLANTKCFNNWDLVDSSAHKIVGQYLLIHPNKVQILNKLANSKMLWERRIAVIATFAFIANNSFTKSLKIAQVLLADKEDLIHKAVGWMLREIGKRDLATEEKFLQKYYRTMPRTMLRYAIEKFPEDKRQEYLRTNI